VGTGVWLSASVTGLVCGTFCGYCLSLSQGPCPARVTVTRVSTASCSR
jgi:hypothetical protein